MQIVSSIASSVSSHCREIRSRGARAMMSMGKNSIVRSIAKSSAFKAAMEAQLGDMMAAGTLKKERVITSSQSASIMVQGRKESVLNFCANNYLGLANNQTLIEAAKQTMDHYGLGLSSVRFICGTQDIHKELERKISTFHGTDDAILYPSCFDANAGLFEAILTDQDAIISDSLNHASIIDGVRLSKAQRYRYEHMDMSDLERKLIEAQNQRTFDLCIASSIQVLNDVCNCQGFRLIATDGVFSMDGDVAPLKDICDLADKYDALVFIDECHATGFFGKSGRGSAEYAGVEGRIDIINSTLGKALGGATGGYTTGRQEVIDILRQKSRPYLFSNTLAPSIVGASIAMYDMLMSNSDLVEQLSANTQLFRSRMVEAGFNVLGAPHHAIAPILLGDARLASAMADDLLELGIYVIGFSFPVVPRDKARIRVQLSAGHTLHQVNKAVDAFIQVGRKHNVIP